MGKFGELLLKKQTAWKIMVDQPAVRSSVAIGCALFAEIFPLQFFATYSSQIFIIIVLALKLVRKRPSL